MRHPRETLAAGALLAAALMLTGCSVDVDPTGTGANGGGSSGTASNGTGSASPASGTSCNLSGCTVVLQRGVDARASVLGIEIELVGVTGDQVSLRVAGQQVSVPLDGSAAASVAGFDVTVESADDTRVVLRITRGG